MDLNKNVFNWVLKISSENLSRSKSGSLFHSVGAAYWNDLSPSDFNFALGWHGAISDILSDLKLRALELWHD